MRRVSVLKLLGLAAVWMFVSGATSCSASSDADFFDEFSRVTFVTDLVLKDAAGAVRQEFAPGEPITLELTVRNRGNTEAFLQFASGHQFDFVVVDDGSSRIRWKWSRGKAFTQATTELAFDAGETKTFAASWNQVDNDGQPVLVGDYEARGVLLFSEFATDPLAPNQLGSPVRAFTIR